MQRRHRTITTAIEILDGLGAFSLIDAGDEELAALGWATVADHEAWLQTATDEELISFARKHRTERDLEQLEDRRVQDAYENRFYMGAE